MKTQISYRSIIIITIIILYCLLHFDANNATTTYTQRIYDGLISTLATTCYEQSNKVESRYLQEKVTSLQVESIV